MCHLYVRSGSEGGEGGIPKDKTSYRFQIKPPSGSDRRGGGGAHTQVSANREVQVV